jgi:hypothetical protein
VTFAKRVVVMDSYLSWKCAIMAALLAGATAMADGSSKTIVESVKQMEQKLGLTLTTPNELLRRVPRTQRIPALLPPAISPDGTALAWWSVPLPDRDEKSPLLMVESFKEGRQPVPLEGRIVFHSLGISSGAEVIVATARQLNGMQISPWELLLIDRRSAAAVRDLTQFVTQFKIGNNVEDISVSGPGTIVAISSREPEQIQVLEIPSGKTVNVCDGRFPRLSLDGKRLAFIHKDSLWIHSFADGSMVQLLKGKRVKGVGGWSPDGRFLLAGSWTTELAFEKRQIIVDTTTDEYAVIGKLGEGDYGSRFAWVSTKLLTR